MRGMRAAIPLVIIGNLGFMYVVALGMKSLIATYGVMVGVPVSVFAVVVGVASLACLADSKDKQSKDMLDRIERKHRVNLWEERARLNR